MQVKRTVIDIVDLKKLIKEKGIRNIKHLSDIAKVDYTTLTRCVNGKIAMTEEMYNKIKIFI